MDAEIDTGERPGSSEAGVLISWPSVHDVDIIESADADVPTAILAEVLPANTTVDPPFESATISTTAPDLVLDVISADLPSTEAVAIEVPYADLA